MKQKMLSLSLNLTLVRSSFLLKVLETIFFISKLKSNLKKGQFCISLSSNCSLQLTYTVIFLTILGTNFKE